MKRFQWKWIFTGSKTCCTIWPPFWFAILAILNPQWPPKYKNPPIWARFGFQVDFVLANWYPSSFLELGAINDTSDHIISCYYYHYYYLLLLLLLFLFFFSPWTCLTKFSETDDTIFTKLHRKVDLHLKRCTQVLKFSKWPPFPWKPWTYVKIVYLTYIGNCRRDFHKTWHIY